MKFTTFVPMKMAALICVSAGLASVLAAAPLTSGNVIIYPAPAGEQLSTDYTVQVQGRSAPVYIARVAAADNARRMKAMDDKVNSAQYCDKGSFTTFDMQGPVQITVTYPQPITSAVLLPSSFQLKPEIQGNRVTFTLAEPRPVTLEINGEWVKALHLFANPMETNIPKQGAPGVVYFGPGIHEVSHLEVTNNQTVYIAGGAIVRGVIRPDEKYSTAKDGLRNYSPTFELKGTNITLRGRGIIDGTLCPTHARHLVKVSGSNINLEGLILRDSSVWTVPIRKSERVTIKNLKLIGYRANSDGIDICNSRDVTVEKCFIRTLDDLIVIKTDKGQGESRRIVAKDCVLWNEVAHALSVGAELRENVDDVLFSNCDVIHDKGREWTLRVFHCDSSTISNIRFENIRVEESRRLISLWIGKAVWTRDENRGQVQDILFKDICATGNPPKIELTGFDATHTIQNVRFQNVSINGKQLSYNDIKTNSFVRNMILK
jgi:polygalacturonase